MLSTNLILSVVAAAAATLTIDHSERRDAPPPEAEYHHLFLEDSLERDILDLQEGLFALDDPAIDSLAVGLGEIANFAVADDMPAYGAAIREAIKLHDEVLSDAQRARVRGVLEDLFGPSRVEDGTSADGVAMLRTCTVHCSLGSCTSIARRVGCICFFGFPICWGVG